MSDGVKINPAIDNAAIVVATDDIGNIHYPIYKTSYGADGSVTQVDGTNPLPVTQSALDIPLGNVTGSSSINKFGQAPDFDTGDGEVTIWDGADDAGLNEMQYTYSTGADINAISSSDAGDTQDYEIQGLDVNWEITVQTVTATGQTLKALTTPLIRIFRIKNMGSTDNAGTIYVFEDTGGVTAGVPNTSADVRAIMQPGNNQTLMAIFTIPASTTGLMTSWYIALASASRTAEYNLFLKARPFGGVFQIKHHSTLDDSVGTGHHHSYDPFNKFSAKTDIEMRVSLISTPITDAGVSAGFDLYLVQD